MAGTSADSLVSCVRTLVAARIAGAGEAELASQAEACLKCGPKLAGEVVDLAQGAAQVAIRADEGEDPLLVWGKMGGPALGDEVVLSLVQAAREAIEAAERGDASAGGDGVTLSPDVASALDATYQVYQGLLPLLDADRTAEDLASAIVLSASVNVKEAADLARQFRLVHRLVQKVVSHEFAATDAESIYSESDGTHLLFRKIVENLDS